jgi:hypothetical protein
MGHTENTEMKKWICLFSVISVCSVVNVSSAGTRVSFDEHQVTIVDGERQFPILFIMPPLPDAKTPDGKNGIEELRDAGANWLRTGVFGAEWDEAALEREQQWQDAAAKNGMYCLLNLRKAANIDDAHPQNEKMLRTLIERFKDHPGMGTYYHIDEPEWGKHPIAPMVRAYKIIKELDPHHPVWVVQAPRGTVESMRKYNVAYDFTGGDIYPIGYPPGEHSELPNNDISLVGDHTRIMMEVAEGKVPVWMCLQVAWSGVTKEGRTLRMPTFPQERFMTYQAIINGARGLVFFGGHVGPALSDEDKKLGWNWSFWRRVLRPVIEEIGEKSPLYPALIAPNSKLPIRGIDVEYCVREVGDELFILACQPGGETKEIRFRGLPIDVSEGDVLFESPRRVTAEVIEEKGRKEATFSDWFAPHEVHVYRFRRASKSN